MSSTECKSMRPGRPRAFDDIFIDRDSVCEESEGSLQALTELSGGHGVYTLEDFDRCINECDLAPVCSVAIFDQQRSRNTYTALVEYPQPIVEACDQDDLTNAFNDIVSDSDSVCKGTAGTTPAPTEPPGCDGV